MFHRALNWQLGETRTLVSVEAAKIQEMLGQWRRQHDSHWPLYCHPLYLKKRLTFKVHEAVSVEVHFVYQGLNLPLWDLLPQARHSESQLRHRDIAVVVFVQNLQTQYSMSCMKFVAQMWDAVLLFQEYKGPYLLTRRELRGVGRRTNERTERTEEWRRQNRIGSRICGQKFPPRFSSSD